MPVLGRYTLEHEIGRGGMGAVFRARTPEGNAVAIKLLLKLEGEQLARFERERRLLASLGEADGFVPLEDAGDSPQGPYLVMPFLTGGTLRQRLERGPFAIEEAVAVSLSLAEALGRAHERGIVHRDLKPENVLFTDGGRALVADLGLAKHFDRGAAGASQSVSLSIEGALRGTAGYMAPEQMADARASGPAADVFALGAILYECLAGRPAFEGEGLVEVLARVTAGQYEPIELVRPDAPPWLVSVVKRSLAVEPEHRYRDGAALVAALRRPEAGRPAGGARLRVGLAALVALAALAGGAFALWPWRRAPRANEADPADAAGWTDRGCAKDRRGDLEGALADDTRAIEADPRYARAWANRGLLKERRGDVAGALADLGHAIEADPTYADGWVGRAYLREKHADVDGALADYTRAIEANPRIAMPWHNRGVLKARRDDTDGALADLTRAVEVDPGLAVAWQNRGRVKAARGDAEGALADLGRAVAADPGLASAWHERGGLRADRGDTDGALADFTRAIAADPRLAAAWNDRGTIEADRGDLDGALADYTRATDADPGLAVAWFGRGAIQAQRGENEGALEDFTRSLRLGLDEKNAALVRDRIAQLERLLGRGPGKSEK